MNMKPKVTVCVITYNHEKYIEECLLSILEQKTNFPFEVIVSDDVSTDNTRNIISRLHQQYPDILKPIFHEKNIGSSNNYNSTHAIATGEYVCHCDGDDMFLPGKLQKQADYLDSDPGCSVVWHKMVIFNDEGKEASEIKRPQDNGVLQKVTLEYVLRVGTVAIHSSIMYRRSAKRTYNPDFVTLDLFFAVEFLLSGYGIILSDVLGKYRIQPAGFSKTSKSALLMRTLCVDHWTYYLKLVPQYRSQIFTFAFLHFLIDLKNRRPTAKGFLKLMFKAAGTFSISDMIDSFKSTRYLRMPKLSSSN